MTWEDVRKYFPDTWVVVEGLRFRTEDDTRIFEDMAILQCCEDGSEALTVCNTLQKRYSERMLTMIHTSRDAMEFAMKYRVSSRLYPRYEDSIARKPALHLSDADVSESDITLPTL